MNSSCSIDKRTLRLNRIAQDAVAHLNYNTVLDGFLLLYEQVGKNSKDNASRHFIEKFAKPLSDITDLRVSKKDFNVLKLIGKGHFGCVYLVRDNHSNDHFAMKMMEKSQFSLRKTASLFEVERNILMNSESFWLTKLHYSFYDNDNLYLIMDYHPGGDLYALMQRQANFSEDSIKFYVAEIVSAIDAVHKMGYIHHDVKPENLLIDYLGHIKLTDFGSAVQIDHQGYLISDALKGTPDYLAPEVLKGINEMTTSNHEYRLKFGPEVDYWSLGVIAFEMAYCHLPFSDEKTSVVYENIYNFKESLKFLEEDTRFSNMFKDLIKSLLTDSDTRASFKEVRDLEFYKYYDWNGLKDKIPPFIPEVKSDDDTSNFEVPSSQDKNTTFDSLNKATSFDLPFVGFTFSKSIDFGKNYNLERRLNISVKTVVSSPGRDVEYKKLMEDNKKLKRMSLVASSMDKNKSEYIKELEGKVENALKNHNEEVNQLKKIKEENLKLNKKHTILLNKLQEETALRMKVESQLEENGMQYLKYREDLEFQMAKKAETDKKGQEEVFDQLKQMKESFHQTKHTFSLLIEENDKLKEENTKLKHQKDASIEQITNRYDERIQELNENVRYEKETNQKLLCKLEDAERSCKLKSDEITTIHQQYSLRLDEAEKKLVSMENYERCQTENKKLDSLLRKLKNIFQVQENEELINTANNLKHDKQSLEESVKQLEKHKKETLAKLKVYDTQIRDTLDNLAAARSYNNQNEENNAKIMEELEDKNAELETEVAKLKNINKKLADEKNQLVCDLEATQKEIAMNLVNKNIIHNVPDDEEYLKLSQELEYCNKELDNQKKLQRETRSNLYEKKRELTDCQSNLFIVKEKLKKKEDQLIVYKEIISDLREEIKQTSEAKRESSSKLAECEEEVQTLQNKLQDAINQNEKLTIWIEDKKTMEKDKANELFSLQQKEKHLEARIDELTSENSNLIKAISSSESKNTELDRQQQVEKKKSSELLEEISVLKDKVHSQEQLLTQRKYLIEEMDYQMDSHDLTIRTMKSEIDEYKKHKVSSLDEIRALKSNLDTEKSLRKSTEEKFKDLKNQFELQMKNKEGDHLYFADKIDQLKSDLEVLRNERDSKVEELGIVESELIITKESLEDVEANLDNLKSQYSSLESFKGKLLSDLNDLKITSENQLIEIQSLSEEKDELMIRFNELDRISKENETSLQHRILQLETQNEQHRKLVSLLQTKDLKKKKTLCTMFSNKTDVTPTKSSKITNTDDLEKERQKAYKLQQDLFDARKQIEELKCGKHNNDFIENKEIVYELTRTPNIRSSTRKIGLETKNRIQHNIPHKFVPTFNMTATKCCGCLNTVHFAKKCYRCEACNQVAHLKCAEKINQEAPLCGLPPQLIQQYVNMRTKTVRFCDDHFASLDPEGEYCSEGILKIYRPGNNRWVKIRLQLDCSNLVILSNDEVPEILESLPLCISDGYVKVIEAVSQAELPKTLDSDLPFVFKLESCTRVSKSGTRTEYLMAPTFPEKQGWVNALRDAIAQAGEQHDPHVMVAQAKVVNELDISYTGMVNCLISLTGKHLCVGTSNGLIGIDVNDVSKDPKVFIKGCDSVYRIVSVPQLGCAIFIMGAERKLYMCELKLLEIYCGSSKHSECNLEVAPIESSLDNCHLLAVSSHKTKPYICVAQQNRISILRWNPILRTFELIKQKQNSEPCGCILFTDNSVLVGTDSVYEIDLNEPHKSIVFIDDQDESLKILKLLHVDNCFPIAIIPTHARGMEPEYLLCYQHVGVFLNQHGKRSRRYNVNWGCLPFAIERNGDFLYLQNYDTIDVIKLDQRLGGEDTTPFRAVFKVPQLRLLGPGNKSGSAFASTTYDKTVKIMQLNGQSYLDF